MLFRFIGASAPFLFLGTSFFAKSLFQPTISVDLKADRSALGADISDSMSLALLRTTESRLEFSLSDFKPMESEGRTDRIVDAISELRNAAKAKLSIPTVDSKTKDDVNSVFNGANYPKNAVAEIDTSEAFAESSDSSGPYQVAAVSRPVPKLLNLDGANELADTTRSDSMRSRDFLANVEGSTSRLMGRGAGSGFGGGANGSVANSGGGGGGGFGGGSFGGGGASGATATTASGLQGTTQSQGSIASNVDQFLSNSSSVRPSTFGSSGSGYSDTSSPSSSTLLASSTRPQLTADGKFGIPNHQYWTFGFKDIAGGVDGNGNVIGDGVLDRKDADRDFDNYLAGLQPKLDAAKQVVKWNPTELRGIYNDLNTQIPTTGEAKSPSYLTFMIIDFPVKGFYLPKSGIPDNPGLPAGGLD